MLDIWPTLWRINLVALALSLAVGVRIHSVLNYGPIIHEFDPWFNFRATEYLVDHGARAFRHWYDDRSWYPLGRPVGPTVYPGLMYAGAGAHAAARALGADLSLHDACVYLPPAFACLTVAFVGLLAHEATRSANAGVAAACVAAVLPAHTLRSVAGAYDNEAVAMAGMTCAFWLWARSLRTARAAPLAALAGLAYAGVASAWGAHPFVANLVAAHAALLAAVGEEGWAGVRGAYAWFYVVGAALAMQLDVVGAQPLRSAELLLPLCVLGACAGSAAVDAAGAAGARLGGARGRERARRGARALLGAWLACVALGAAARGPLPARVRSLFLPHVRTGNPLVDSVAEHRRTAARSYLSFVHVGCVLAPPGVCACVLRAPRAGSFVALYAAAALFFSLRMVRLMVLVAPPAAVGAGAAIALAGEWAVAEVARAREAGSLSLLPEHEERAARHARARAAPRAPPSAEPSPLSAEWWRAECADAFGLCAAIAAVLATAGPEAAVRAARERWSATRAGGAGAPTSPAAAKPPPPRAAPRRPALRGLRDALRPGGALAPVRPIAGGMVLGLGVPALLSFVAHSLTVARSLSEPLVVTRLRVPGKGVVVARDYLEAYAWLGERTPAASRVLAWWDYGYHVSGIANRTSLADGNTWNHEHIGLVARCLLLPPARAHAELVRHLADYVLLWTGRHAGRSGDDLAKAAHMARIAGSVFDDVDEGAVRMRADGPSDALRGSLLYALHAHRLGGAGEPDLSDDAERAQAAADALAELGFEEAFTSTHRMARVYRVLRVHEGSRAQVDASYARMHACHAARGELDPACRAHHGYPSALARARVGEQTLAELGHFRFVDADAPAGEVGGGVPAGDAA